MAHLVAVYEYQTSQHLDVNHFSRTSHNGVFLVNQDSLVCCRTRVEHFGVDRVLTPSGKQIVSTYVPGLAPELFGNPFSKSQVSY